jgi:aminopeptidase-like protein
MKYENVIDELDDFLRRLFPLCRSITGNPNRETLKALQDIVPISIREVPTGTKVYDWTIPEEWSIHDAWIADATGNRIVDYQVNNLHVVSYSQPVNAVLDWAELSTHLHRHPELKDAIPYRTSYYNRNWGFCITDAQYQELLAMGGPFTVVIDSELNSGSLTYGEYLIPGCSTKEILISCYICHPSMANDSLSGVILTAFLARYITTIEQRRWTYRIVFVPETIGAIAYCALNESSMKQIDFGLVITTVGGPGRFGYKQSWDSGHYINVLIEKILGDVDPKFITYPFDIHGSDERQYSSQGFRINIATICKDRYYEYPYYHSSLDNLDYVTAKQLFESLEVYKALIESFETLKVYKNTIPYCEVMLSRHGLYPKHGGAIRPDEIVKSELDIILWLLHYCDGRKSLQQIALLLDVKMESLTPIVDKLINNSILTEV